jgi:hypothetical protein
MTNQLLWVGLGDQELKSLRKIISLLVVFVVLVEVEEAMLWWVRVGYG